MVIRRGSVILNENFLPLNLPTVGVELKDFLSNAKVCMKRDDLIHPIISGNKFRKLYGFIKYYYFKNFTEIVTVGSAHSNYIHAISFLAFQFKIPIKVFIYGHHEQKLTYVLKDLNKWNISWGIIDRSKDSSLHDYFSNSSTLFVPEGANHELADEGVKHLIEEINSDNTSTGLLLACGTGACIRSILRNTHDLKILSVSPVQSMKQSFQDDRLSWLTESLSIPFAGFSNELMEFITWFYNSYQILLDPIYTSRLLFELQRNSQEIVDLERIICIHSGGIQAWRDYKRRYPLIINSLSEILDFELQKFQ